MASPWLRPGSHVQLYFKRADHPLNGRFGILEELNESTGEWQVQLVGTSAVKLKQEEGDSEESDEDSDEDNKEGVAPNKASVTADHLRTRPEIRACFKQLIEMTPVRELGSMSRSFFMDNPGF